MKSARQWSRLEKTGPRETHQVAARSELSPESQIKLKIFQSPPIHPEIYSRFGNSAKLGFFQPVDGELPVTKCRQKDNLYITYEEKVNPMTSKRSQKEKKQW